MCFLQTVHNVFAASTRLVYSSSQVCKLLNVIHFFAIHHNLLPATSTLSPERLALSRIKFEFYSGCFLPQSPSLFMQVIELRWQSAMSSAKSRSSTVVRFHLIPLLLSAVAFLMSQSKHSKNRNFTHPCLTPDLIINQSDVTPPWTTAHSKPAYMPVITLTTDLAPSNFNFAYPSPTKFLWPPQDFLCRICICCQNHIVFFLRIIYVF